MGFFDSLFGATDSKSTTTIKLPDWVDKAGMNNYELAQSVAGRPYQPYKAVPSKPTELIYEVKPDGRVRANMSVYELVQAKMRKKARD